jgi:putative chitinase
MSLKNFQTKIGTSPDGIWGKQTFLAAMRYYQMTPFRAAHFFGQTGHETGGFRLFSENMNYSAQGLARTFPKYFPTVASARPYQNQPEKIANKVYGSRMGNGDEASGDGWKFRGRGALGTTGKENYQRFANYIKKPEIMTNPDLVATEYPFESAIFFFDSNKLWSICDRGITNEAIKELTRRVNGGYNGLDDRILKTNLYYQYTL